MKRILFIFPILFSLLFSFQLFAQPLTIDLSLFNPQAQVFYVGDIDIAGLGNAPNVFSLRLQNLLSDTLNFSLEFKVRYKGEVVVRAFSNKTQLPPLSNNLFTNDNLNTGMAFLRDQFGQPTNFSLELKDWDADWDAVEDLKNQVIATGKLPSGSYEFLIDAIMYDENWVPTQTISDNDPADNILVITNPTTLEPLTPGNRVSEGVLQEIPSPYPTFLWQSDASYFNLFVFEKYSGDETIQDVISHDPMLHLEKYPNQIFQYPTDPMPLQFYDESGNPIGRSVGPVRMLEPGKIYYWYVQAIIPGISDEIILSSDVYQFKVTSQEIEDADARMISLYLDQLLSDQFQSLLEGLEGYSPTGVIYLNNTPVQVEVLLDLLNKMNQNKIKIVNVSVE